MLHGLPLILSTIIKTLYFYHSGNFLNFCEELIFQYLICRLRTSEDAKKRAGFPRFGSKYRYSGRTLHETRRNASMADRPSKQFDRVASRQSLNSVLTKNRAQSRDNCE